MFNIKMKIAINIFKILIFLTIIPTGVVLYNTGTIFNSAAITIKRTQSNAIHAACIKLGVSIRNRRVQLPRLENVSFQLRTPCMKRDFPVTEITKLMEFPEFDLTKKTIVFVTGWLVGLDQDYIDAMAKAYHCRGGNNFLVFNAGGYLSTLYIRSASNIVKLGEFIAIGLARLAIRAENIHLIGHSLGAHIVGSAGRYYEKLSGEKISRITGLDPARPCFVQPSVFPRLQRSDAIFTDIIHTNPTDLGLEESIGHADFYVGGLDVLKPGCTTLAILCSHELAIDYFMETVREGSNILGNRCRNFDELFNKACSGPAAVMGYGATDKLKGIFYTPVSAVAPYVLNAEFYNVPNQCGICK
ncbi:phospholipase A1-like [Musca autumnalis]|uniref:phospholipase A1-like n=1 Tax=Musca autumnalis TaxID=221902 RepID=UPI003CF11F90